MGLAHNHIQRSVRGKMSQLSQVVAAAVLVLGAGCVWPATAAAAQNQGNELPEAPGKAAVLRACAECHEIGRVTRTRDTEAGWRRMVNLMVASGAELSESEIASVTAYLAKYFGRVNVNKAAAAQLEEALGLPQKEARAIIVYREQNGEIKNLEQLKNVPGVSPDKIQAKAAAIAFRD
jgi:competence protein ComEA